MLRLHVGRRGAEARDEFFPRGIAGAAGCEGLGRGDDRIIGTSYWRGINNIQGTIDSGIGSDTIIGTGESGVGIYNSGDILMDTGEDILTGNGTTDGIYSKGTPINVRGSLLFNHHIKEKKLTNKYSLIQNGEKIKYCYLKKPNPIYENVISFIQDFPKELGLNSYIDYDTQFEKGFLEPLKVILNAIGWADEKKVTLDSFFS